MGFRFIRPNTEEYEKVIREQKKRALAEETKRWSNLTALSPSGLEKFILRFEKLRSESTLECNHEKTAQAVEDAIHRLGANIAKIQGNMEIRRISALLENEK